jgi:hypothetical protein
MNLDTDSPESAGHSRSPTPSSTHSCNDSPQTSSTLLTTSRSSNGPLYENVNTQPALPKRNSRNNTPDPLPEAHPRVPPVAKPKPRTKSSNNSPPQPLVKPYPAHKEEAATATSSSSLPTAATVVPKPRPRKALKSNDSNGPSNPTLSASTSVLAPAVTQQQVHRTASSPLDAANRPTTPTVMTSGPHLRASVPDVISRPKSPDMARRPLPLTPGEASSSSSSSSNVSPMKSPSHPSPGHRSPRKVSTETAPVDLSSTYSLMGATDDETASVKAADKSSSSIMDTVST